ncbi:MAG: TetR/AcrR family transcriptional regulator [Paenibacillaceae bacterium]|uniref:TetR/AcrR family transcriptional regulator n=1 Tax=Paenibacillus mellifer TaxID=2937794 RepID=A0A9X1XX37_9BACL|nr:TetR/AcrR family transcriptional regulator [Paenibacillus mellifer]MBW4838088.1 TetR/AcrR family transcriptional regulator [Paenibacillaceae bacterium]MCK8486929.1 TetR/AcrR family transcriptional regulator [Paenibacillus mellifer]
MNENGNKTDDRNYTKGLPHGIALTWGLIPEPKRGPKRELSIPEIVSTAVALADKDGLAAVSMSRVAGALGYTAMSLYRYIPSKDDLLLLMQEAIGDIPLPEDQDPDDWRGMMRTFVWSTIQIYKKHPWFADLPIYGAPITPHSLRFVDWALKGMRDFPISGYVKMSIILLLSSYARACGILQRDMDRAFSSGTSPGEFSGLSYSAALKELVTPEQFPYLHPLILSGEYTGEDEADNDVGNDIEFGLERILDGVEHYLVSAAKR